MGTRLDSHVQIPVIAPLKVVNRHLLELLGGLDPDDWHRATVHKDRSVKDLAAHLPHGSLRRVTSIRDRYKPQIAPRFSNAGDLTKFIQDDNRMFMTAMSGVSPQIICELIARYDSELVALFETFDPVAPGLGVVWAGEWQSQNWFDVAREYTEKWHHQQQLRDATGHTALYEPALLIPALETFARGLPFAYRDLHSPDGTAISIAVTTPVSLAWTLRRSHDSWSLWQGTDRNADATIKADADTLWRVWTKGLTPDEGRHRSEIAGSTQLADPLLGFVAIMA